MRGRFCTQPFLVEKQTRYPLSPRRFPSLAPLGESIAPSSAPVCALGHLWFMVASPGPDRTVPRTVRPPRGRLWGWEGPFPSTKPTLPSPPSRWAGRYGRKIQGRRPGKKEGEPPQGPPNQKRWVQGGRTSSSLVFFPPTFFKESRAPPRSSAGNPRCRVHPATVPTELPTDDRGPPAPLGSLRPSAQREMGTKTPQTRGGLGGIRDAGLSRSPGPDRHPAGRSTWRGGPCHTT